MVAKAYCGQYEVSLGTEEEQFIGSALDLQKKKNFFLTCMGRGAEREGDRESEAGSTLSAQIQIRDSNPQTEIMT